MRIISYVCADLYDGNRSRSFRIRPTDRGLLMDVPDWVSADPLFKMLVSDGSVRVAETRAEEKILENNPMVGVDAEGRGIAVAGGENPGDSEVNRNKQSVRGTAAPIEVADKSAVAQAEEKPARRSGKKDAEKPGEAADVKTDEKPREEKQK